ncbi:MAG: hypothetical protein WDN31_09035 [Hyphomicrobium sp.]
MTAEFYLETVQWVFQEYRLAKGELDWKGRRVNPKADPANRALHGRGRAATISARSARPWRRTISAPASALPQEALNAGRRGHYGVFAGRRWASQIYPLGTKHHTRQRIGANE